MKNLKLLYLVVPLLLVLILVGLLVIWRTRYVSLGSVVGAALAPPLMLLAYSQGRVLHR